MRYRSSSFDVVTSGFALRDFDSTERFAKESYRVLRRGGKIVLLDMSKPNSAVSDLFFKAYFGIMRLEGLFVNNDAYNFLVNSIKSFDIERFRGELEDAGFRRVRVRRLTFGVAFLITGYK
jgi:demethylmenaquinone methyltransferase/2-methoxy-6-polyprenyl-1,4-benzoquinol methylase